MIYPSWYPDCQSVAVDVTGAQVTAKIDATTGQTIQSPLANDRIWAGFPSVNQTTPTWSRSPVSLTARATIIIRTSTTFGLPTRRRVGPGSPRWSVTHQEGRRLNKYSRHAPAGGRPMVNGLPSNPTGLATISMVRLTQSLFKMPMVSDPQCRLVIAANGMFSIRSGFRREMTARFS